MIFLDNLFKGIYKKKKILVTGHTGFKGSWLSIWLKELGAEVIGYSLEPSTQPSMFEVCDLDNKIINIYGDVRDISSLDRVFEEYEPDVVFHLAAQPLVRLSYKIPKETYETNIMGTVNVLDRAKEIESVKAVIVITSDKCYENKEWVYGYRENDPMGGYDPYSSSKACAELVVSAYRNSFYNAKKIALSSARAGNVIGGGDWAEDRLIPDFIGAVIQNRPIYVRNPGAIRPWQHVLEPLSGYLWLGALMLLDREKYNGAWNFGPNDLDALKVGEVLDLAIKAWGSGEIVLDDREHPHEANLLKLDVSKARTYLKWRSIYNAEQAVEKTIEWYKKYYTNAHDMYEFTVKQICEYIDHAKQLSLEWSKSWE